MMFLPCFWAFCACIAFCFVFNIRGKTMFFASLGGAIGWFVYLLSSPTQNDMVQFFFATIAISIYAEIMARVFRLPVTTFQLTALLPMVPGGGIYYTMEYYVLGNTGMFIETGLHTLGVAGALAMGILLVSSFVRMWRIIMTARRA